MSVSKNEKDKKPLDDNKICIVIPTFNNEKTIASIIKRTLRFTYQIIIIDDGCTDHTHGFGSNPKPFTEAIAWKKEFVNWIKKIGG